MKKMYVLLVFLLIPNKVFAGRGCCSHHGGVAGCNANGNQICADGSLSPTCTCTPSYVYGCTDNKAYNYNSSANKDDGSCKYYTYGCTDSKAKNYNSSADKDDGSCEYEKSNEQNKKSNKEEKNSEEDNSAALVTLGLGATLGGIYVYKRNKKR